MNVIHCWKAVEGRPRRDKWNYSHLFAKGPHLPETLIYRKRQFCSVWKSREQITYMFATHFLSLNYVLHFYRCYKKTAHQPSKQRNKQKLLTFDYQEKAVRWTFLLYWNLQENWYKNDYTVPKLLPSSIILNGVAYHPYQYIIALLALHLPSISTQTTFLDQTFLYS